MVGAQVWHMEPLRFDTSVNIKELFPAHSRKIDALEQRFTSSPTTVVPQLQMDLEQSNNEIEEEELYSDTDEVVWHEKCIAVVRACLCCEGMYCTIVFLCNMVRKMQSFC